MLTGIVYAPQSRLVQSATFGNGLNDWNTYTEDYELDVLGLYDGPTTLINRAHTRTDALNLTNIFDNVTPTNNAALWYSPTPVRFSIGPARLDGDRAGSGAEDGRDFRAGGCA